MQLNGTEGIVMAASEAPDPPPRNPDKINASLKQTSETVIFLIYSIATQLYKSFRSLGILRLQKSSKSLDVCDRQTNNNISNGKTLQSILSLDSNLLAKTTTMGTKLNDVAAAALSPSTAIVNETAAASLTTVSPSTPANNSNCSSPQAEELIGKIASSKSSSSSISATSASKVETDNNAAVQSSGCDELISNNRNDNDGRTNASDANNKLHENNATETTAVSASGEWFGLKILIATRWSFNWVLHLQKQIESCTRKICECKMKWHAWKNCWPIHRMELLEALSYLMMAKLATIECQQRKMPIDLKSSFERPESKYQVKIPNSLLRKINEKCVSFRFLQI